MSLIIKDLSYIHPSRDLLFHNINLSLVTRQKAALIGNNGSGKSTLFKILTGYLKQSEGEIIYSDKPFYVPQHFGQYDHLTIAEVLGADDKIKALHRILGGDASEENFSILNDEWNIEEKVLSALQFWGMESFAFTQRLSSLSGGEKTKVFLSGILLYSPDVILMDEPTNHLDRASRNKLYNLIGNLNSTLLVISHDRVLLNLLSPTYELHKEGINLYGGNYDFYKNEKEKKLNTLKTQLSEKEKELRKVKKMARETAEKQQKHDVRGEKQNLKKGVPKIVMGNLKSHAEKSSAKLKEIHSNKIEHVHEDLEVIRKSISFLNKIKLDIHNTTLHQGKILVDAKGLNFSYKEDFLWNNELNFQIRSGERWVIEGNNGSGKTTLIKLMVGQLFPKKGSMKREDITSLYIDQNYSIIDNSLSVYQQVQEYNSSKLLEHEIKTILNRFLFSKEMWDKKMRT